MEQIIAPVERELLKKELTPDRRLRRTNKRDNEIYVVTYQNAPNVVREIGRLREIAFREAGGGTGKACDLDEFDTMDVPYRQLIVWDPQREEILGGYRYLPGPLFKLDDKGQPILATSHMFHFSQEFIDKYMRSTIELGRSFVTVEYQSSRPGSRGLFTLDNLWDGLGALTFLVPGTKYFFGKMTMYPSFDRLGRDMILYFLNKHFGDKDKLVTPMTPVTIDTDPEFLKKTVRQGLVQGRLQDSPHRGAQTRVQHSSTRKRLHEPEPHNAHVRHSHKRHLRQRGGNGNTHSR